jgi:hypothetical protein
MDPCDGLVPEAFDMAGVAANFSVFRRAGSARKLLIRPLAPHVTQLRVPFADLRRPGGGHKF